MEEIWISTYLVWNMSWAKIQNSCKNITLSASEVEYYIFKVLSHHLSLSSLSLHLTETRKCARFPQNMSVTHCCCGHAMRWQWSVNDTSPILICSAVKPDGVSHKILTGALFATFETHCFRGQTEHCKHYKTFNFFPHYTELWRDQLNQSTCLVKTYRPLFSCQIVGQKCWHVAILVESKTNYLFFTFAHCCYFHGHKITCCVGW